MAMKSVLAAAAAPTADELSNLLFGEMVGDVLAVGRMAEESLGQLGALLHSISDLVEAGQGNNGLGGREVDRLHALVGLGRYVVEDASDRAGYGRERMETHVAAYRAGGEA